MTHTVTVVVTKTYKVTAKSILDLRTAINLLTSRETEVRQLPFMVSGMSNRGYKIHEPIIGIIKTIK